MYTLRCRTGWRTLSRILLSWAPSLLRHGGVAWACLLTHMPLACKFSSSESLDYSAPQIDTSSKPDWEYSFAITKPFPLLNRLFMPPHVHTSTVAVNDFFAPGTSLSPRNSLQARYRARFAGIRSNSIKYFPPNAPDENLPRF